MSLSRLAILPALILAISGCATPRHETVVRREAPTDPAAQTCLQACERDLAACRQACAEKYTSCVQQVKPEAEAHYRQTLDQYAQALDHYRHELSFQDFQLWAHFHGRHGGFWYDPFPHVYSVPLPPPRAPTREEDLARLLESRCGGDCGCQSPYDACFVACGGRIVSEQRCVAHCPEPQREAQARP